MDMHQKSCEPSGEEEGDSVSLRTPRLGIDKTKPEQAGQLENPLVDLSEPQPNWIER